MGQVKAGTDGPEQGRGTVTLSPVSGYLLVNPLGSGNAAGALWRECWLPPGSVGKAGQSCRR